MIQSDGVLHYRRQLRAAARPSRCLFTIKYSHSRFEFILGETGVPYDWEYGDHAGKS